MGRSGEVKRLKTVSGLDKVNKSIPVRSHASRRAASQKAPSSQHRHKTVRLLYVASIT
jgi:hypothetical protein